MLSNSDVDYSFGVSLSTGRVWNPAFPFLRVIPGGRQIPEPVLMG